MRSMDNPQYALVALYGVQSTMNMNLRHVDLATVKQLRGRLSVPLNGGSQLVAITESKAELEAAVKNYKRIHAEAKEPGGIILRDRNGNPAAKLYVTEDGNLLRERIVAQQPGTPRV